MQRPSPSSPSRASVSGGEKNIIRAIKYTESIFIDLEPLLHVGLSCISRQKVALCMYNIIWNVNVDTFCIQTEAGDNVADTPHTRPWI